MEKLKDFAQRLTKAIHSRGIPQEFINEAKENGIVIVYGYSDDNMEFDGAIYDEVGCFDGGTAYLTFEDGVLLDGCQCFECEKKRKAAKTITAVWCDKENGWTWSYVTDIPHETFEMKDDDEKFCLGIVFYKDSLKGE